MDLGNFPAWIALCVSVVSPIITSGITLRHQTKLNKLNQKENKINNVINAFSNYLSDTNAVIKHPTFDNINNYGKSFGKVTPFLTSDMFKTVISIDEKIQEKSYDEALEDFYQIQKEVYDYINEVIKK